MRLLYPAATFRIPSAAGMPPAVYLTFDDGPNTLTTPYILKTLRCHNAGGTFFVVGENVVRYPSLMHDIISDGHSVGLHGMKHKQGLKETDAIYYHDIDSEADVLLDRGITTSIFRPSHGLMRLSQYRNLMHRYSIIMFDIVTGDYREGTSPKAILDRIKKFTRNGSIIVFHDSEKGGATMMETLPLALEWLRTEGYECRAIPMGR